MPFIEEIKNRAKQQIKTIILPINATFAYFSLFTICAAFNIRISVASGNKEEIERLIKENNLE